MGERFSFQRSTAWPARRRLAAGRDGAVPVTDESDHILNEATDWLLALTERPGDRAMRARFRQWIESDSRHAEIWKDLNHSYDLIGEAEPELSDQWQGTETLARGARWLGRRERSRREAARPARPIRKSRIAAVAASLALAIWLAPDAMLALRADYRTATSELRMVRLEDGSTAQLGPDSAIRVSYGQRERRVELLAGQALFQVQPNKARPFRVHADEVTTTVLGTGFDVRRLSGAIEVGVQHGRVRVDQSDRAARPVYLQAGDQVTIEEDGKAAIDHVAPQLIASWALGEVNARDRAIAEVIDEIRPWYRGRIILMDGALGQRRVNGVYNPRDAGKAIRSIVLPLGGTVMQITPWLIVIRG